MTQVSFIGLALTIVLSVVSYSQAAPAISLEKRHDTENGFLPCIAEHVISTDPQGHIHLNPGGQSPTGQSPSGQDPTQQGSASP